MQQVLTQAEDEISRQVGRNVPQKKESQAETRKHEKLFEPVIRARDLDIGPQLFQGDRLSKSRLYSLEREKPAGFSRVNVLCSRQNNFSDGSLT